MAFPSYSKVSGTIPDAHAVPYSVPIPTPASAGDLAIVMIAYDGDGNTVVDTGSSPDAVIIADEGFGGLGGTAGMGCAYEICGGGETYISLDWGDRETAYVSILIPAGEWEGTSAGIEHAHDAGATSDTHAFPQYSPSWGSADTLWVAFSAQDNDPCTSGPTGWSDFTAESDTDANIGFASNSYATGTVSSGTFTHSSSDEGNSILIAIEPAAGEPAGSKRSMFIYYG